MEIFLDELRESLVPDFWSEFSQFYNVRMTEADDDYEVRIERPNVEMNEPKPKKVRWTVPYIPKA